MKKIFIVFKLVLFVIPVAFICSCVKAGLGGNGTISGICCHHRIAIPFDSVAIKYNAVNLPGITPSDYDNMIIADSTGHFIFKGLKKGNYYLYAWGFDTSKQWNTTVTAGIPVKLGSNSAFVGVDTIPVNEGD
jgi:hypothetical protein